MVLGRRARRPLPPETCLQARPGRSAITGRWLRSSPTKQQQPDAFALPISRWVGPRRRSIPLRKGVYPMSFKPEVIADTSGKWCGNALRFATREEAEANVRDLMMRWFAVRETRIVESDDPVNYRYVDGRLESLTSEAGDAGAISFNPAGLRVWRGFCVLRSSYAHSVAVPKRSRPIL